MATKAKGLVAWNNLRSFQCFTKVPRGTAQDAQFCTITNTSMVMLGQLFSLRKVYCIRVPHRCLSKRGWLAKCGTFARNCFSNTRCSFKSDRDLWRRNL